MLAQRANRPDPEAGGSPDSPRQLLRSLDGRVVEVVQRALVPQRALAQPARGQLPLEARRGSSPRSIPSRPAGASRSPPLGKRNRLPEDKAGELVYDGLGVGVTGNLQPTILHAFLFDAVVAARSTHRGVAAMSSWSGRTNSSRHVPPRSGKQLAQVVVQERSLGIEHPTRIDERVGLGIQGVKPLRSEEVQLSPVNARGEI